MESVTVPFSPASKSLANMVVTKEPAGTPAHNCNERIRLEVCELGGVVVDVGDQDVGGGGGVEARVALVRDHHRQTVLAVLLPIQSHPVDDFTWKGTEKGQKGILIGGLDRPHQASGRRPLRHGEVVDLAAEHRRVVVDIQHQHDHRGRRRRLGGRGVPGRGRHPKTKRGLRLEVQIVGEEQPAGVRVDPKRSGGESGLRLQGVGDTRVGRVSPPAGVRPHLDDPGVFPVALADLHLVHQRLEGQAVLGGGAVHSDLQGHGGAQGEFPSVFRHDVQAVALPTTRPQTLGQRDRAALAVHGEHPVPAAFQAVPDPPVGAAVAVVRVGDEQHRARERVLGHGDGVAGFGEHGRVVVDVLDGDGDLRGAVHRGGGGVGLEDQQGVGLGLVVQALDVGDQAGLRVDGEQTLRVSGRDPLLSDQKKENVATCALTRRVYGLHRPHGGPWRRVLRHRKGVARPPEHSWRLSAAQHVDGDLCGPD
ncbi:hypothetical protein EYF80_000327 [Liparis tanakae]|uniref:Uncharacterized protein n=1 Tax=Liparis tanakae TaxID=230148 RepID=A0A4Z2JIY7_9TELE|nr:hypothetical protein EYF80_000327 [Liparis tanakae]